MWPENYHKLDYSYWQEAEKKWKEKQYYTAFKNFLDFINPRIRQNYEVEPNTHFRVPHGSSIINIYTTETSATLICYLAKIEPADIQAVYIRSLMLNNNHLRYIQLTIDNNVLVIKHEIDFASQTLLDQYKVLKEICLTADHLDDLIIQQYRATFYAEPQIKKLGNTDKILARSIAKAILQESNEYLRFFEWQNNTNNCLAILRMALKRIDLALQPQGYIKSEITTAQAILTDDKLPVKERIITGKLLYDLIKNMSVEDFDKNIYLAEHFMPEKKILPVVALLEIFKECNVKLLTHIGNKDYLTGATLVISDLYSILYQYLLTNESRKTILLALQESAEKDWQLACKFLNYQLEDLIADKNFGNQHASVGNAWLNY